LAQPNAALRVENLGPDGTKVSEAQPWALILRSKTFRMKWKLRSIRETKPWASPEPKG
jgi:hypothetical protein